MISYDVYKGFQSCRNWPLEKMEDLFSKKLTKAATELFEEHLEKYGYEYEIITDIELLKEYVSHCKELQLEIVVMKVMSCKKNSLL